MQLLNKKAIKNSIAHTWFLYPISIGLVTAIWMWGFYAFHQPSNHQKLTIFFATDINNESFMNSIMNKHYDKEKLRLINPSYTLPNNIAYYQKLQIALSNADMLILDETTLSGFEHQYANQFTEMNDYVKGYLKDQKSFYQFEGKDYGVLIKQKETQCYLNSYMTFDEAQNYYLVLTASSTNLGARYDEANAYYDNALTYMSYLLEGDL